MSKQVKFSSRPTRTTDSVAADQWVSARTASAAPEAQEERGGEKMKRLTIDIPESLHRRFKAGCVTEGKKMADVMRQLIEERFPQG